MPRTKEQNDRIKEDRRREILDAAIPLLARYGFATTNVSQIAEAAGVSYGTVFLYFPSKEALFRSAVLEGLDEAERVYWAPRADGESAWEHLNRLVRLQLSLFLTVESFLRLIQQILGHPEQFPDLTERVVQFSRGARSHLVPIISAAQAEGRLQPGPPELLAALYFSHLIGVGLTMTPPPGQAPNLQKVDAIAPLMLRLFGPAERTGTP